MLGLLIALGLASCKKGDYPPTGELWQLSVVQGGSFQYKYNEHRLLTNITRLPWGMGPNFVFTHDQWGRLLTMRDSIGTGFDQFIYQNGKLVRIDGGATEQTVFTYDNKGRIIRKDGNASYYDYVVYDYEGNSRNYKRASYYSYSTTAKASQEQPSLIFEYTYDNKINPYATISTSPVIPFWFFGDYLGPMFYDPVIPNNVVNQKFFGQVDTGYFKFMEHNYTYTYDHNLPVSYTMQNIHYNRDGTISGQTTGSSGYTYEKFHW